MSGLRAIKGSGVGVNCGVKLPATLGDVVGDAAVVPDGLTCIVFVIVGDDDGEGFGVTVFGCAVPLIGVGVTGGFCFTVCCAGVVTVRGRTAGDCVFGVCANARGAATVNSAGNRKRFIVFAYTS